MTIGTRIQDVCLFILPMILVGASWVFFQNFFLNPCSVLYCLLLTVAGCFVSGYSSALYKKNTLGYALFFAGYVVCYLALYQAYVVCHMVTPVHGLYYLFLISGAALLCAGYFHAWLIAVVAVIAVCIAPVYFLPHVTRLFLAWYSIICTATIMVYAYCKRWPELIAFCFSYMLYHSLLFTRTVIAGPSSFLTVEQAVWCVVGMFSVYTLIPFAYSVCSGKNRIFEPFLITYAGTYSFFLIHRVISYQLILLKKVPFFLKIFIGKTPTMQDIQTYMFFVLLCVYVAAFLLSLCSKRAIALRSVLLCLCTVTLGALMCSQPNSGRVIHRVARLKNIVPAIKL